MDSIPRMLDFQGFIHSNSKNFEIFQFHKNHHNPGDIPVIKDNLCFITLSGFYSVLSSFIGFCV